MKHSTDQVGKACAAGRLINSSERMVRNFASCITRTYRLLTQSDAKRSHENNKFFIMCKIIVVVKIPKKN